MASLPSSRCCVIVCLLVCLSTVRMSVESAFFNPYKTCGSGAIFYDNYTENIIACNNLQLYRIPPLQSNYSDFSWTLDISDNEIMAIYDGELVPNLQGFVSERTPLRIITEHAFSGSASSLHKLHIESSLLSSLPGALMDLVNLHSLTWNDNPTQTWDSTILAWLGQSLTSLTLENMRLTDFPKEISLLHDLVSLDLFRNKISEHGNFSVLHQLQNLTELKLWYNGIADISPVFNLGALSRLDLESNRICNHTHIPYALIPHESSLKYLDLGVNCLSEIPDLMFLSRLEELHLSHNSISNASAGSLPDSLLHLTLGFNKLTSIPVVISKLPKLKVLSLTGNQIQSTDNFIFPSSIEELWISEIQMEVLNPLHFSNSFSKLRYLYLQFNPLKTINSGAFSGMPDLEHLNLEGIQITRLPLEFLRLTRLHNIQMTNIPNLVCTCTEAALGAWYNNLNLAVYGNCGGTEISYFLEHLAEQCPTA